MYTNETSRMLADGGIMQDGGSTDPVSGNDVPPGAMKEEVRDDIDAKLSEGEFVIPADVVRYIGLSTLMKMRDKAKEGLKKMEEIGQMGNAEEVPNPEALHSSDSEMDDESFSSEVDSILGESETPAFAEGGYVDPTNEPLYKTSPLKGFEMVTMVNEAGNTIYIPHLNGKPLLAVPAGYSSRASTLPPVPETPTTTTPTAPSISGSSDSSGGGDSGGGMPSNQPSGGMGKGSYSVDEYGFATPTYTDPSMGKYGGGFLGGLFGGIPGAMLGSKAGEKSITAANEYNALMAAEVNMAVNQQNFRGLEYDAAAKATAGEAANAAAAATAAAVANGYSPAAVEAAAQAAVDAVTAGASVSDAVAAGAAAAATVANDIDAVSASRGYESTTTPSTPDTTTTTPDTTTTESQSISDQSSAGSTPSDNSPAGGFGEGQYAKGGFVSKKKNVAAKSNKGLASRK